MKPMYLLMIHAVFFSGCILSDFLNRRGAVDTLANVRRGTARQF